MGPGRDKKERCELEARWIQGGERGLRVCWRQIPQNLRGNEGEAGRKKRKAMSTKNEVDNVIIRECAHEAEFFFGKSS